MTGLNNTCRMCESKNLETYLDFGYKVPSDAFRKDIIEEQHTYPLAVQMCMDCGLSQLTYVVDPVELYQNDYPYESSSNEAGKKHYNEFAENIIDRFNLSSDDLVVDIGSNVGVLLEGFKSKDIRVLGIDPAQNIVDKANAIGIKTICSFFSNLTAEVTRCFYGSAKIITATNVFAHVDNLTDFMKGINNLLDKNGVFIFESPTLLEIAKTKSFDACYHEHLCYLSLMPIIKFVNKFNLEVFDVEKQDVHQGSFRVFIARKGEREIKQSVIDCLKEEQKQGIHNIYTMKDCGKEFMEEVSTLNKLLYELKSQGKTISLLSAPAKGMTILGLLYKPDDLFEYAIERTDLKIGRFCPGTNIEVVNEEHAKNNPTDYQLLLAWNWREQILKNNMDYINNGGKIIIPLPEIEVYEV